VVANLGAQPKSERTLSGFSLPSKVENQANMVNLGTKTAPMRIFVALMACTLLSVSLLSCTGIPRLSRQQKRDAAYLMGEKRTYLKKWQLVETYDPYQGGTLIRPEVDNPTHLMLFQDGDFIRYDRRNYSSGQWALDRANDRMALTFRMQNNRRIPPAQRDTLYRYQIQHRSADSLVLGVQGRHGVVELRYRKVPFSRPTD